MQVTGENVLEHPCPSCGRPTLPTSYEPEPDLCVACQRSLGVLLDEPTPPTQENPSWGLLEAGGLLVASILALYATEIVAVGYLIYEGRIGATLPLGDALLSDPTLTVIRIVASGIAHVITLALAWYVVTDGGRTRFFESIGWGWRPPFTPATVGIVFAVLFFANIGMGWAFDKLGMRPETTPFDDLLKIPAARIAVAIFAVVSAPFVEEVVFRGVLYPALARRVGRVAAVLLVSTIFLYVHVDQYAGAVAYLVPLGLLSLVLTALRAYSGSLLPSIALHLLFNAVQVVFILTSPEGAK